LLFGVPLLFTLEMWWLGESMSRIQLLGFLVVGLVANTMLAQMSGFRPGHHTLRDDIAQACQAMAVGIVISIVVLLVMGRIDTGSSLAGVVGSVAVQVLPLSLGATVANLVFGPDAGRTGSTSRSGTPLRDLGNDVLATIAGAIFVGFAIAPTEEVPMLAAGLDAVGMLAAVGLALFAGYLIVFASGFDPVHRERQVGGLFQHPFSETMLAYVISLISAAALLYGFDQISGDDPAYSILAQVIVLSIPASIGGAAGRVVV